MTTTLSTAWLWNNAVAIIISNVVHSSRDHIGSIVRQPYFIVPFLFWCSCYIYCQIITISIVAKARKNSKNNNNNAVATGTTTPFHKWYTIHNIHNFGAILLGTISIVLAHPYPLIIVTSSTTTSSTSTSFVSFLLSNYNERIPILWSLSYFIIDIMDCCIRRDLVYSLHGICCFVLGYMNYTIPILQLLKMNSKATYCELSNPFMHLAKRTRQPTHFVLFALVYTLCRILWIPMMYYQLMTYEPDPQRMTDSQQSAVTITKITWYHPISCILVAFYILNLYWYMKIINILLTGGGSNSNSSTGSKSTRHQTGHADTKKDP